ncbi:MAG: LytTR family DNA-binding domain-containing protein [Hyphomonadaceae bacterium]
MSTRILRAAGIALGLGVLFAWFGVYQTSVFPLPERIAYWTVLMGVGIASSSIANPLVINRWLPRAHPLFQVAAISALISVPITIGLGVIEFAADGIIAPLDWWGLQYLYVIALSAVMTSLAWIVEKWRTGMLVAAPVPAVPATAPAGSAFTERLPVKFRSAQVYAVSAEDHYLRVHTSLGETMILMRLADAVRELASLEGLQTHRSWWVAKQGLADASKGDGKVTLKLKSGAEAPVSRTYQKAVKDAGWT